MNMIYYNIFVLLILFFCMAGHARAQVFDKEPHKRIATISKALKDSTRTNPEKFLPILTERLIAGISDPFEKVKIIHDWITTEIKYDTEPHLRYSDLIAETYEVLRHNRGICVGYSNVFNKMCGYANIESVSIVGVAKPWYITEEFLPEKFGKTNHMWSGVKINGKRYLLDLTWDAGYTYKGEFTFKYSTAYLFADPKVFITHHYPSDEGWQLLEKPYTWTRFRKTEFEEPVDKLQLTGKTIRGGISFSKLYNLNIPDINETAGFNISFSSNKAVTNELALELELSFDHMNIDQDMSAYESSSYFDKDSRTLTDPVTGVSLRGGSFNFEKIGAGLNLKYHLQNETSVLPFLKTGLSISTPFSFSGDRAMVTRESGRSERVYKIKNFGFLDQILYGVMISAGADLIKNERSENQYFPIMGIELRWLYTFNSIKLFENYDEGKSMFKSYSVNFMFYF